MFEPPRPTRRRPLTRTQERVLRLLGEGQRLIDDVFGCRLEPSGMPVHRLTVRALTRAGLVEDPGTPLFNPAAGQLTTHGCALNTKLGE